MSTRNIWCSSVLLPGGWENSVVFGIGEEGALENIRVNCTAEEKAQAAERISGVVVPGMPNLHSHAHQRAMAGLAEKSSGGKDNFWSWRSVMYQMLEKIEPEHLYDIARMLYLEMLQAGYTHVAEFQYLHHQPNGKAYHNPAEMTLQCLQAARDVGIGFTALPVLYRYGGFGEQPATEGQKRFTNSPEEFSLLWHNIEDALHASEYIGVAPHSLRAVSKNLLEQVFKLLPADIVTHLHIAEQIREVEDSLAWCGQRPMEWLMNHFSVGPRWCLIHATHLDESERNYFAASGAVAGLCPTTEANLGDGLFDAPGFFDRSGRFGVGSDSQISVSVTEELRWLEYGQRLALRQRNVLAGSNESQTHCGARLFREAVDGGSQACGFLRSGLVEGAKANFIVLDSSHPRLMERENDDLIDSWIFSAGDDAISAVYTGGQRVIDRTSHSDKEEIHEKFHATLKRLGSD